MIRQFTGCLLFLVMGFVLLMPTLASGQDFEPTPPGPPIPTQAEEPAIAPQADEAADNSLGDSAPQAEEPEMLPEDTAGDTDQAKVERPVEVIQERYPNGKVRIRREVTQDEAGNYILHGEWKMWDEKGNLMASGRYKDNQRHGSWVRRNSAKDSKLFSQLPFKSFRAPFTSVATFDEGELHGKWTISDAQNRKISEWEYDRGARHGTCTWRYPSDKILKECTYRNGLLDGHLRQYNTDGKLVANETYEQGQKVALKVKYFAETRTSKGKRKESEGMYLFAQLVIDTVDDWWAAKPATYKPLGRDMKHGLWIAWHPNGQRRVYGNYDQDLRDGKFIWWHTNGQEALSANYQKGEPDGGWVWWHENGQKSATGQYINGEMNGMWVHWKKDGQLYEKSDFSAKHSPTVIKPEKEEQAGNLPKTQTSQSPTTKTTKR